MENIHIFTTFMSLQKDKLWLIWIVGLNVFSLHDIWRFVWEIKGLFLFLLVAVGFDNFYASMGKYVNVCVLKFNYPFPPPP